MKRQLERCILHVRTRKQFGKPIGKNQSVANNIVDMAVRPETCRPLVYRIGWPGAQGKDATLEAAMAKLHVSDCYVKNSLDAVQLFGAAGFVLKPDREGPSRQHRQHNLLGNQRDPAECHRPVPDPLTQNQIHPASRSFCPGYHPPPRRGG